MQDIKPIHPDVTSADPKDPPADSRPIHSSPETKPTNPASSPSEPRIPASPTPSNRPIPIEATPTRPLQVAEALVLHEEALKKAPYKAPRPDRLQDDWQATYVWAFIIRFGLREKIRKLECMDDFERCLTEPVANRPDDIFEGILIRFLSNLKPGLRNLDPTNIQAQISNYVHEQLSTSTEFTVWDPPWPPLEVARGPCCSTLPKRAELGSLSEAGTVAERIEKNPIRVVEGKGGGLFELDWFERSKLLRQLVDWQLTHSESIRAMIKPNESRSKAKKGETYEDYIDKEEPLGVDRNKNRIWAFDHSGRLFRSGIPFKRPCPLVTFSSTLSQTIEKSTQLATYGKEPALRPAGSGSRGRLPKAEEAKHKKVMVGKDNEKALAEKMDALIPLIEKEEARVQRQKKKVTAAVQLAQMAEVRSTRTRRPTRKVDYSYNDDDQDVNPPAKRSRRGSPEYDITRQGRPVIPGERRSSRFNPRDADTVSSSGDEAGPSASGTRNGTPATDIPDSAVVGSESSEEGKGKEKRGMKGYAWVEDYVPPSVVGEHGIGVRDEEKAHPERTGDAVHMEGVSQNNGHHESNGQTVVVGAGTVQAGTTRNEPIEVD